MVIRKRYNNRTAQLFFASWVQKKVHLFNRVLQIQERYRRLQSLPLLHQTIAVPDVCQKLCFSTSCLDVSWSNLTISLVSFFFSAYPLPSWPDWSSTRFCNTRTYAHVVVDFCNSGSDSGRFDEAWPSENPEPRGSQAEAPQDNFYEIESSQSSHPEPSVPSITADSNHTSRKEKHQKKVKPGSDSQENVDRFSHFSGKDTENPGGESRTLFHAGRLLSNSFCIYVLFVYFFFHSNTILNYWETRICIENVWKRTNISNLSKCGNNSNKCVRPMAIFIILRMFVIFPKM